MHTERVMPNFMVLAAAFDRHFRYGIFERSQLIGAIFAASTAMSLPMLPMATSTAAVFGASISIHMICGRKRPVPVNRGGRTVALWFLPERLDPAQDAEKSGALRQKSAALRS